MCCRKKKVGLNEVIQELCIYIGCLQKTAAKIIIVIVGLGMLGYMIYKQWVLAWWTNPPCVKLMIYAVTIYF